MPPCNPSSKNGGCVAAHAFTPLPQYLADEISISFLRLSVSDMSNQFHWVSTQGFTANAELDCKEQYDTGGGG